MQYTSLKKYGTSFSFIARTGPINPQHYHTQKYPHVAQVELEQWEENVDRPRHS
jgi:hypothetical protein